MADSEASEDDACWSESDSDDEQKTAGAWKRINCNRVHVHVDDVDALLLVKAREEVECVVGRLLLRMFGTTRHRAADVSISRVILIWLDSTIISKLQQFVNVSLDEAASVTIDELFQFLEVELWLGFYHVTPGFFFDKENRSQYPPAERCMPFELYRTIIIALGKTSSPELEKTSQWIAPFSTNRYTTHVT
ncbi:unnamed protein product [Phytophthora fragariaefolia]|uniref:Unnamed protein product n=1 Tax=Phytophthora fragariaefolia TaxID=1490495 RepID=A0A9W7D2C4_9STRA|nr:unnamed protein product [Phytophthora fragariaefolia]